MTVEATEGALEAAATRYEAALPEGTLWSFPVTALDQTGVPSWSVTLVPGTASGGHGYGWTEAKARVSALGELHERLQSALTVPMLNAERASYRALRGVYGVRAVVDPLTLCLPAGSAYTPDIPQLWVRATRFGTGESVWVPLEAAASGPGELPGDYRALYLSVSNGLGAGFSTDQALTHALLELVQRDGNSVAYRALDRGVGVSLAGAALPGEVTALLERFEALGVRVEVKLAATDFDLTNLYVVGARGGGEAPGIMAAAAGEACSPDKGTALEKALLEYAAARTRLALNHGPLGAVARVAPPGYLDVYRAAFGSEREEARALAAMVGWLRRSPGALRNELARVYEVRTRVPWDDLPAAQPSPGVTDLEVLADLEGRLRGCGFDLLYLELASPQARAEGVRVVKAVVPGLEVETLSYGRIGARNLGRLLEQGSPFVGLGAAPAGAAPVRLTAEAEAQLGGSAWLDLAAVARLVEPLYPLYREPSRHAALWQLEREGQGR